MRPCDSCSCSYSCQAGEGVKGFRTRLPTKKRRDKLTPAQPVPFRSSLSNSQTVSGPRCHRRRHRRSSQRLRCPQKQEPRSPTHPSMRVADASFSVPLRHHLFLPPDQGCRRRRRPCHLHRRPSRQTPHLGVRRSSQDALWEPRRQTADY